MSAVGGHYTSVYNSLALGITADGWTWEIVYNGEIVTAEEFGDSAIDILYRGGNMFLEATFKNWTAAGMAAALSPYATFGQLGTVGTMAVRQSLTKPLVLTALTGSMAATDGPVTITAHNAILTPDTAKRINLNNLTRLVPLRFQLLLADVSGTNKWFTVT